MLKKFIILILFLLNGAGVFAQGIVKGKVLAQETSGTETLPGASVIVKGTTNGTTTDVNGEFSLSDVPGDAALIVSFIGYAPQEVLVNNQSDITVELKADVTALDEVVVVGYGTVKKGDLTSAIASVGSKALEGRPVQSTQDLLQGQVAGLTITNEGGEPGSGGKVRIRGVGTFGNNSPLYIVDGIPVNNGLNFLNPNDIESIEVFKDAAAAAIYGNRAANGVIYVTTKKGKDGKTQVTFDSYYGIAKNGKMQELADGDEYWSYLQTKNLTGPFDAVRQQGYNTNWTDAIMRTGKTQSYNIGLSGGNANNHFFTSVGYSKVDGTHRKSDNERLTVRLNSDHKIFNWLTLSENLTITNEKRHNLNLLGAARGTSPLVPIYKTEDQIAALPDASRPLNQYYDVAEGIGFGVNQSAVIERSNGVNNWLSLIGNVQAKFDLGEIIKPLTGLNFSSTFGFERFNHDANGFGPIYRLGTKDYSEKTSASQSFDKSFHWTWNNFLTYNRSFGKSDVGLTAGVVGEEVTGRSVNASGTKGLSNSEYLQVVDAMEQRTGGANAYRTSYGSYVGRITYNYDSRYLIQASIRRDGSYNFAPGNRWGTFPSVGLGWRISNEQFFQSAVTTAISNLKLRASWGQLGNDNVPSYQHLSTIVGGYERGYVLGGVGGDNSSKTFAQGYAPNKAVNPNLKWETTTSTNFGLDMGLLNNKISVTFDYYMRNTSDVIFKKQLPFYSGFPGVDGIAPIVQWVNGAEVMNRGYDLSINYANDFNGLGVELGVNFGHYNAKVSSLDQDSPILVSDERIPVVIRMEEGDPLGGFYGYQVEGFYNNASELLNSENKERQVGAQVGDFKFKDINGDGVVDSKDKSVIGNPNPKLTYSFNLNFNLKGFDLRTFWYGIYGNDIYKIGEIYYNGWDESTQPQNIFHGVEANSWTEQNMNALYPKLAPGSTKRNYEKGPTTSGIQKGSFFRLKNIQLGYTFPKAKLFNGFESLRLYVAAENVFVITKYNGGDPEIGGGVNLNTSEGGRGQSPSYVMGLDYADRYPIQKTFTVGLSAKF